LKASNPYKLLRVSPLDIPLLQIIRNKCSKKHKHIPYNNYNPLTPYPTMLFTNVLTYALAFASATPMVAALYHWDEKLQLYTLGEVPAPHWNNPKASAEWTGQCNGGDIPEGGYGCGTFIEDSTVICKLHAISPSPLASSLLSYFQSRSVQSS
jgi:hypothetical protein